MDVEPHPSEPALLRILQLLGARGYAFTTITPASHARVLARRTGAPAASLRDVFGWSLPFRPGLLDGDLLDAMWDGGALKETPEGLRSLVRVSTIRDHLFLHSAYPPEAEQAVFLGPDTSRFVEFVLRELPHGPAPRRVVEIGAGAGAAGLLVGLRAPGAQVTLADVNPVALRYARVNAAFGGRAVDVVLSDGLAATQGSFDLIVANPPFMVDGDGRTYRHGGGLTGGQMSLDWASSATGRLRPGGKLLLYTGSAIVEGRDLLKIALQDRLTGFRIDYRELDPDVFGEELDKPAYGTVDRIAAVAVVIEAR